MAKSLTGAETLLDLTGAAYRAETIAAAQAAIDGHTTRLRLEDDNDAEVDLWHMLASLLEWADAYHVDFDATLESVRDHLSAQAR